MKLKSLLRSLSHRNFRLYFIGQGVSVIGTWMQKVAMSWLVYQLTGSSFQLGLVLFCGQIPALLLSPVAGVLVDRWHRPRLLLLTQTLSLIQAFLLAWLDMSGHIAVWQIMVLSLFLGIVTTFDMTGRQAFISEIVIKQDLGNAVALNASVVNLARLIGPSLAGMLLAWTSTGFCFLVNGFSYFAVLVALLAMQLKPRAQPRTKKKLQEGLQEGFDYAFGFAPIRLILLAVCLMSMAGSSYDVLLPQFAAGVLHGNARTLGLLGTAVGLGSLTGAVFLTTRSSVVGLGKWLWIGLALMGIGLISFAHAPKLALAMPALVIIGFGMMVQLAVSNTLLQTIADEDKVGRVMSFYTMSFLGMAPLGSLFTGWIAARLGIVSALMINGSACLLGAAAFCALLPKMRELIRPVYIRLKILPVTAGIDAANKLKMMVKE